MPQTSNLRELGLLSNVGSHDAASWRAAGVAGRRQDAVVEDEVVDDVTCDAHAAPRQPQSQTSRRSSRSPSSPRVRGVWRHAPQTARVLKNAPTASEASTTWIRVF